LWFSALIHPEVALLTIAPGGLRAPWVTYLWIKAENHKNDGKYFDAMQLADQICMLQPRFPGVWSFHAWNMAWNISVATHTPEERWLWVTNGLRLLRDRGIPLNPKSLLLYKDVAWIFYTKMGMNLDDMHVTYKQRWASQMQHLLGSPPQGDTPEVIDAFGRIAQAPLDTTARLQESPFIQGDQLRKVLEDSGVAAYANLLAGQDVPIDRSLLDAYNRFSRDEAAEMVRVEPPKIDTARDKAVSDLINSKDFAGPRAKLLAFVRAQLLWNEYGMDPRWMLALMEKYDVPIDWRLVWPHGLYWASYGLKVCNEVPIEQINSINTDRISLGCLKDLVVGGRMTYLENPSNPDYPSVDWWSDWRYIKAAHKEYVDTIEQINKASGTDYDHNYLKTGHINFLILAIQTLLVQGRYDEAEQYYDWIKKTYTVQGDEWKLPVEEFAIAFMNKDRLLTEEAARSQVTAALQMAYYLLARGNMEGYQRNMRYARRIYEIYQKSIEYDRLKLRPFESIASHVAAAVLVQPYTVGYYLPLMSRVELYSRLPDETRVLAYDRLRDSELLADQCKREGIDFDKSFPAPPGLEEYRQWQQQQLRAIQQGQENQASAAQ